MSELVEVDGLEAVITLLRNYGYLQNLVGGRIDTKHRYGQDQGDWSLNDKSIVLTQVQDEAEIYLDFQPLRIQVRCYAGNGGDYEATLLYRTVLQFCNDYGDHRTVVNVNNGNALVYFVLPVTAARFGVDNELAESTEMIYSEFTIKAQVSNKLVAV